MYFSILRSIFALALVAVLTSSSRAEKIKILIIDGQNNHAWKPLTEVHKKTLERTGLFTVDVSTTPPGKGGDGWDRWRPDFSKYDAVLSNYNGVPWPDEVKQGFVKYVKNGGGVVIVHAANNSFPSWQEYNEIIGIGGWGGRNEKHGPYLRYRDGKVVLDHSKGRGGSHGPQHAFKVVARNEEHPIMKGLPKEWKHAKDELYDSLRGPAQHLTLLATAYSEKSKEHEPMMMVLQYGKGRVFHTPMGHTNPVVSVKCVGFQTVLVRGAEWAATGKVTTAVPENFPTADKVSIAEPEAVTWKRVAAQVSFKPGSCCDKASKAGKACGHACCKKAAAAGTVCKKCNG